MLLTNARPSAGPFQPMNARSVLRLDEMHQAGARGQDAVVAILDTGYQHDEVPLLAWKDLIDGSPTPVDPVGHGTHVAGEVHTAAPEARLVAVRVMGSTSESRPEQIAEGIDWLIAEKQAGRIPTDVINISMVGGYGVQQGEHPINLAVDRAVEAGMTVVAAAGNFGPQPSSIGVPGNSPAVISVGSIGPDGLVSDFSSRGPTQKGLGKPDLVAPGERIASWAAPGSEMQATALQVDALRNAPGTEILKPFQEDELLAYMLNVPREYQSMSPQAGAEFVRQHLPEIGMSQGLAVAFGTSFASPLVAGVVACLKSAGVTEPEEARDILRQTAVPRSEGSISPMDQGAGLVDAAAAWTEARRRHPQS